VIVRDGSVVVGFAALAVPVGTDVEIVRIMTRPSHVGRGVASTIITALVRRAEGDGLTVWLDVLEMSQGAIRLYERLGFTTFGCAPGTHSHRPARQMRRVSPSR
jgi:ribosomal protein S18 acetylase RimI-like enzyme